MSKGFDCASRLTAENARRAKAAGFDFVGRYLGPDHWPKALTKGEAEAITGAGLRLLTVFESTADRALGGWDAGVADGITARRSAEALQIPKTGILYFAVDFDAKPEHMKTLRDYLAGAFSQAGEYRIGVYGSYRVIEEMAKHGVCDGFWQCCAWSYGMRSPALTVYQSDWSGTAAAKAAAAQIGVSVDLNDCPDMRRAGIWTYHDDEEGEETMTGRQIYESLYEYLREQPVPDWARQELQEAMNMGITDGTDPMTLIPRYQAAIMAKRAADAARRELEAKR